MLWNWLQLSDLHCGMGAYPWLWPRMEERLFQDLAEIHGSAGPWHLVLITGDLVQKGSSEEFREFGALLDRLWAHLEKLGSRPLLLAVPGNHDLERPEPSAAAEALKRWASTRHIPDEFWLNANGAERQIVSAAFANYQRWWQNCAHRPTTLHEGALPGEFAFSLEHDGASLGIVGLNSSFMQLGPGDYKGHLGLHASQFRAALPERAETNWTNEHELYLLLTHQPPDWLMPDSVNHLRGEIAPPGQFAAHLFGHMHESRYVSTSEGGSEPRNHWQALSLFGLESYAKGASKAKRLHGYCAGRLRIVNDSQAQMTFWPRKAERGQDGALYLVADTSCRLLNGLHTPPLTVPLVNRARVAPPAPANDRTSGSGATAPLPDGVNVELNATTTGNINIRAVKERVVLLADGSTLNDINIVKG